MSPRGAKRKGLETPIMRMSEVITVRVKKTLKEKIRKHRINVSKTSGESLKMTSRDERTLNLQGC